MTIMLRKEQRQKSFQVRLVNLCQAMAFLALLSLLVKAFLCCAGSPHYSDDFEEEGDDAKEHPGEVCISKSCDYPLYFHLTVLTGLSGSMSFGHIARKPTECQTHFYVINVITMNEEDEIWSSVFYCGKASPAFDNRDVILYSRVIAKFCEDLRDP